jgi:cell wall assembly regulator SMI1/CheY-like chemotaxis protein
MPEFLDRLDRWMRLHRLAYYDALRPGVPERELTTLERDLGRNLPAGFRALYRWHDGQDPGCPLAFQYNQLFMPLRQVRVVWAALGQLLDEGEFPEANWWSKAWLPFLGSEEGNHLCVDLDGAFGGVPGQVLSFYHDWECRNVEYPSLEKWMEAFVPGVEAGLWERGGDEFKPRELERVKELRSRVAPGYPREQAAGGHGPVRTDTRPATSPDEEAPTSSQVLVVLERTSPVGMVPAAVRPRRFPYVIGRDADCDLPLMDPALSRRHCRIDWRDGLLLVEDLGSRNGTLVNGKKVTGPHALAEGDQLRVGASVFAVRLQAAANVEAPRRVLVVEDDADAAEAIAALLRGWGHDVQVARDGERALAAARGRPPDTVLLDLNLGEGPGGLEVAHRLRQEATLQDTRVLAVTGHPPQDAGATGGAGDLDGVLVKPVDARALRQALVDGHTGVE